jgi:Protein of unknown function (DUF3224)
MSHRILTLAATALLALSTVAHSGEPMSHKAIGTFSVKMTPIGETDTQDGVALGNLLLEKTFEGDLVGTGSGRMLTALTPEKGSAGYVAIERVTGTLNGRAGSFTMQHTGTMDSGAQQLSITLVPGSGTGALAGIRGVFKLRIEGGKHYYDLEYTLP